MKRASVLSGVQNCMPSISYYVLRLHKETKDKFERTSDCLKHLKTN